MKTFRITYTQASENMVEIEAANAKDAWKQIVGGDLNQNNVQRLPNKCISILIESFLLISIYF